VIADCPYRGRLAILGRNNQHDRRAGTFEPEYVSRGAGTYLDFLRCKTGNLGKDPRLVPGRKLELSCSSIRFFDRLLSLAVHIEVQLDTRASERLAPAVDGLNDESLPIVALGRTHRGLPNSRFR
jgi:hypothetical protein